MQIPYRLAAKELLPGLRGGIGEMLERWVQGGLFMSTVSIHTLTSGLGWNYKLAFFVQVFEV